MGTNQVTTGQRERVRFYSVSVHWGMCRSACPWYITTCRHTSHW